MRNAVRGLILVLLLYCSHAWGTVPFVVGTLYGQLGNQCFQIAATLSLAWDQGATPYFPDLKNKHSFGIPTNYDKVFWRIKSQEAPSHIEFRYSREDTTSFSPIPYRPNMQLDGYFQSEKYFEKYASKIRSLFAPSSEIVNYLVTKYSHILRHPNTVSIHVRNYLIEAGNYDPPLDQMFEFPGREYVKKAIAQFPADSLFVVFSDDIPWCKKNLKGLARQMLFIEEEAYYHDFYLMSLCKHNIISNSTFSWWAAYLNANENKTVIAPKKWFKKGSGFSSQNLILTSWREI